MKFTGLKITTIITFLIATQTSYAADIKGYLGGVIDEGHWG